MEVLELIRSNLLTPIVLFFLFGIVAARIRSDLRMPEAISEFLPIYLLAAIGLHGGVEMRGTDPGEMLVPMLAAVGMSLLMTLNHYQILRRLGGFGLHDAYALASTYGAVGAVTFSVGLSFLRDRGVGSEGYLAAVLAVLEPVAFILAIFMANAAVAKRERARRESAGGIDVGVPGARLAGVLRDSVTGKAIVVLLGSIVIGYVIGGEGYEPIAPVFDELFVGAVAIFMIEMGLVAGRRLEDVRGVGAFLVVFALAMPTANGAAGVLVATALGLSLGGSVMFGLLMASASFIAAPAVLRHAMPEARPSLYITSALGITFPYNIIVLLPVMFALSAATHAPGAVDLFRQLAGGGA